MKRYIKPTTEQRNEVNDLVLDIQKLLDGKEWGPSLAALTIHIGEIFANGSKAQLLVASTGSNKTEMAIALMSNT